MKRIIVMYVAVLMMVMIIPQNVYALEQCTPSGMAYDDIGTNISHYMKEYEDGLVMDLREALERIAPTGMEYHHDEIWHDGNGYAHVRAALVGSSVSVALVDGLLNLGTWQQIVLLDFDNKPRSRNITVQIIY